MINAIQAWMLQDAVVEEEHYKGRQKAKVDIMRMLAGESLSDYLDGGEVPGIVYDENGAPRPARMAYDESYSDEPTPRRKPTVVRPLPPETVPLDDYDNPFPGLSAPLG